jgi:starvation-inducible outer membrane lipoprotein
MTLREPTHTITVNGEVIEPKIYGHIQRDKYDYFMFLQLVCKTWELNGEVLYELHYN